MNRLLPIISFALLFAGLPLKAQEGPRLLIRGDDIGSTHAANLGCIRAYEEGIMQSVEIMVPCPWFPEAVKMLKETPGLDVGVHITMTSEWENLKWRPLTHAPSISDEDGYFFPMVTTRNIFPEEVTLMAAEWKLEEIEAEMRAQIEMALKYIPQVSHLSDHMGSTMIDKQVAEVYKKLAKAYKLDIDPADHGVKYFPARIQGESSEERIASFIEGLKKLEPGETYLFVEHPALAGTEMEAIGHEGYYTVNTDRQTVVEIFTSPEVKNTIEKLGIELISYADLNK